MSEFPLDSILFAPSAEVVPPASRPGAPGKSDAPSFQGHLQQARTENEGPTPKTPQVSPETNNNAPSEKSSPVSREGETDRAVETDEKSEPELAQENPDQTDAEAAAGTLASAAQLVEATQVEDVLDLAVNPQEGDEAANHQGDSSKETSDLSRIVVTDETAARVEKSLVGAEELGGEKLAQLSSGGESEDSSGEPNEVNAKLQEELDEDVTARREVRAIVDKADSGDSFAKEELKSKENPSATRGNSEQSGKPIDQDTTLSAPVRDDQLQSEKVVDPATTQASSIRSRDEKKKSDESSPAPVVKSVEATPHNLVAGVLGSEGSAKEGNSQDTENDRPDSQQGKAERPSKDDSSEEKALKTGLPPRLSLGQNVSAASEARDSESLSPVDRARFIQRVSRAFQLAGERDGQIQLRLAPPELGSLRLEVTMRDGVLSARMEVETQSARNILLDNLPALRERLAQQDIKVANIEIDIFDLPKDEHQHRPDDRGETNSKVDRPGEQSDGSPGAKGDEEIPRGLVHRGTTELNVVI